MKNEIFRDMKMNNYMVIGSNCFTGSHIVDALLSLDQSKVIGVSRSDEYNSIFLPYKRKDQSRFEFHRLHLVEDFDRLCSLIEAEKPQVVVNVAALSEVALSNHQPVEYFSVNTVGTVRLCNYLRRSSFLHRYIHISSAEIFGSCDHPVDENDLFNPSTPYAVSKAAADMYINSLIRNFDFPATLIRSTNVYGRHQQLFKIIPRTIIYLKKGRTLELHGGGTAVKSFVHIKDVVRGVVLALERGKPGTYHFSSSEDRTILEIVRMICEMMGCDFEEAVEVVGERLGQDARYTLDYSKAAEYLDWSPRISLEDGIRDVSEWIEDDWDVISKEPLEYVHKV